MDMENMRKLDHNTFVSWMEDDLIEYVREKHHNGIPYHLYKVRTNGNMVAVLPENAVIVHNPNYREQFVEVKGLAIIHRPNASAPSARHQLPYAVRAAFKHGYTEILYSGGDMRSEIMDFDVNREDAIIVVLSKNCDNRVISGGRMYDILNFVRCDVTAAKKRIPLVEYKTRLLCEQHGVTVYKPTLFRPSDNYYTFDASRGTQIRSLHVGRHSGEVTLDGEFLGFVRFDDMISEVDAHLLAVAFCNQNGLRLESIMVEQMRLEDHENCIARVFLAKDEDEGVHIVAVNIWDKTVRTVPSSVNMPALYL